MLSLIALLLGSPAHAEDCDARQLAKDIDDASPVAVPRVYLKLAECDAEQAKKSAELALSKTLHGDEGNQAALAALKVGAQPHVMDWVDGLEPNHRAQTMLWLGDQCADVPEVGQFFVDSAEQKASAFLKERWYRGMAKCRVDNVQALLVDVVENDSMELQPEQKFGFIEVYARNLGKDAIPHLRSTAGSLSDPKDVRLLINAFGDAANVGSLEGINEEAAAAAIEALDALAPQTHPDAINQVRDTLLALGAPDKSDAVVQYRWADRKVDGTYHYGVVATEDVTCKNGKQMLVFHHGVFTDVSQWPDALEMDVEAKATDAWELNRNADKCKGTAALTVKMSPQPLAKDGYDAWLEPHKKGFDTAAKGAWKSDVIEEEPTAF